MTWLADVMLGPQCVLCGHRARGPRSLQSHQRAEHGVTPGLWLERGC